MEKNIYQTPLLLVADRTEDDVICASGDTDVPFIQETGVEYTWRER